MRIPTYDSQVTPNAPRFSAIADVRTDSLSDLAKGLDVYAAKLNADNEEALKTEYFKADTAIKYELEKGYAEIADKIKNGGAYANAEAEYQKLYDSVTSKYGAAFVDENVRERQMAEYKRQGLESTLRIKDAVRQRRKSDAVSAASTALDLYSTQYFDAPDDAARQAILGKVTERMAGLTAVGAIDANEAKSRIRDFVARGDSLRITMALQDGNVDLAGSLLEKNKSNFDPADYVRIRGAVVAEAEKLNFLYDQAAAIYGDIESAPVAPKLATATATRPPKPVKVSQEGVDGLLNEYVEQKKASGDFNQVDFETKAIDMAIRSRIMPSQISEQAALYMSMDPETASAPDIATAASMARIISNVSDSGIPVKLGLDKETVAKAKLFNSRMESGVLADKAFRMTSTLVGDEEKLQLFKSAQKEARRIVMGAKVGPEGDKYKLDMDDLPDAPDARMEWQDLYTEYRALGAGVSEAAKKAKEDLKLQYKEFNGVPTRDPITNFVNVKEEDVISKANEIYTSVTGSALQPDERLVVVADRVAKRQIMAKEKPDFIVMMKMGDAPPVPVINPKTVLPLRIRLEKENVEYIKRTTSFKAQPNPLSMGDALAGFFAGKTVKEEKVK